MSFGYNNFSGGGIVSEENNNFYSEEDNIFESLDLSEFSLPCMVDMDFPPQQSRANVEKIKRLLNMSGWYHGNITWQTSDTILKNKAVGRWLLRDSSDYRYFFAL